jgi:hypothetical protein
MQLPTILLFRLRLNRTHETIPQPTSAKVKDYYNALNQFGQLNISHETAVRQAFASLLDDCARKFKWKAGAGISQYAPKNKSSIVD